MVSLLEKLLNYFEDLNNCMNRIYPEKITWENVNDYNFNLDVKHPDWVKAYFPLVMIYYREKAGKLRKSKSIDVMYQNNFNVITQLVPTADDFGIYNRKLSHKGFKTIVGAIQGVDADRNSYWDDMQKPKKYKNFDELYRLYGNNDFRIKIFCDVLSENYPCNSHGQLKLL